MINATRSAYIKVPRELALLFKDNVGAQRAFSAFLEAITAKVDGSNSSLSDLEQRSGGTASIKVHEAEKRIEELHVSIRRASARLEEVKKEIESLSVERRSRLDIVELNKRLDDIESSARPRG